MAAKPGPFLAVAAIAALLLMGKKGPPETPDYSDLPSPDDVPEGGDYPDTTPDDSVHSGGGKKVPSGSGHGGGSWLPPKTLGPDDLWFSPDCLAVYEGPDWFEDRFLPKILEYMEALNQENYAAAGSAGVEVDVDLLEEGMEVTIGGAVKIPAMILGFALIKIWDPREGTPIDENVELPPNSCIAQSPWFQAGINPSLYSDANGVLFGDDAAKQRFLDDLADYRDEYPMMAAFLISLEDRMNRRAADLEQDTVSIWNLYED
jgi:hypothetical protein